MINSILEKTLKEFDGKFQRFPPEETYHSKIKDFISSSIKSAISEVLEEVKLKEVHCEEHKYLAKDSCYTCQSSDFINQAVSDQSEKIKVLGESHDH